MNKKISVNDWIYKWWMFTWSFYSNIIDPNLKKIIIIKILLIKSLHFYSNALINIKKASVLFLNLNIDNHYIARSAMTVKSSSSIVIQLKIHNHYVCHHFHFPMVRTRRVLRGAMTQRLFDHSCQENVCLPGTYNHCLCVSSEGRVFARLIKFKWPTWSG